MKRVFTVLLCLITYIVLCCSYMVHAMTPADNIPIETTVEETIEELIISPADDIPKATNMEVETETETSVEETTIEETVPQRQLESLGYFKITYYCPCSKCNGKWGAIDGFGNPLVWGTVASDKSVIPMHTHLLIEGYEDTEFVVRDTGSGVRGKHIDIFVPVSHKEALNMPQGQKLQIWKIIK